MKLYYNQWRSGVRVDTLRRPARQVGPARDEEIFLAGNWWYNPLLGIPFSIQLALASHYTRIAIVTYGLIGRAAQAFVMEKIAAAAWLVPYAQVGGIALMYAAAYLVAYIWNPPVRGPDEQIQWGGDWMLRYEEHVWDAAFYYWHTDGMPVFRIRADYGNIIATEAHNRRYAGYVGDVWNTEGCWLEDRGGFLVHSTYMWYTSVQGFVGFCDRWSEFMPIYKLQKQYAGFLPML